VRRQRSEIRGLEAGDLNLGARELDGEESGNERDRWLSFEFWAGRQEGGRSRRGAPRRASGGGDPGLNSVGGIPRRGGVCARLGPRGRGRDDTSRIQRALDRSPAGRVVKLQAGMFRISGEGLVIRHSNITLRGSGWRTQLVRKPNTGYPLVIIGERWPKFTQVSALTADAAQGPNAIQVARSEGLRAGDLVIINQRTDPTYTVWGAESVPGHPSRGWFGEYDRPLGQVLEVKAISGSSISFTTPLHVAFRTANAAHLIRYAAEDNGPPIPLVRNSGVEDLSVANGDGGDGGGDIHLFGAAYSWVRNVNGSGSTGSSVSMEGTFRCVLRDSYLHSTRDPNPGGGGYGIDLRNYASDNLVENNISWNFNKVMAMRETGGGNVIAYNYMEDSWGSGYPQIMEVGLNASHMTTPHHELFEGNQSFNFDSDSVWGNSIYITVFRNHLTGKRRSISPLHLRDDQNRRAAGLTTWHRWYSFLANVLGYSGQQPPSGARLVYEKSVFNDDSTVPMWQLGYNGDNFDAPQDQKVVATTIRHGNFDYVTKSVAWDPSLTRNLPASLYLTGKPAFFGSHRWPWVTPDSGSLLGTLPARERFDAIHKPVRK
jgi:hypothetical protein